MVRVLLKQTNKEKKTKNNKYNFVGFDQSSYVVNCNKTCFFIIGFVRLINTACSGKQNFSQTRFSVRANKADCIADC